MILMIWVLKPIKGKPKFLPRKKQKT